MPERPPTLVALSTLDATHGCASYGFSTSPCPLSARFPDRHATRAMQQINITVINPRFNIPLFGPGAQTVPRNGCILFHASIGADGRR